MGCECGFTDQSALRLSVPLAAGEEGAGVSGLAPVLCSPQRGRREGPWLEQLRLDAGCGCLDGAGGCDPAQPVRLGRNSVFLWWDGRGTWSACQEAAVRVPGRAARPGRWAMWADEGGSCCLMQLLRVDASLQGLGLFSSLNPETPA